MAAMKFGFGQPLTRKEDDALLRGAGTYIADVAPQGALHAVVLRATHAHAKFAIGDLATVRKMKGVRLVLTGTETAALGPLPTPGVLEGVDIKVPHYPILALDVVRHVGDAIAFVTGPHDGLTAQRLFAAAVHRNVETHRRQHQRSQTRPKVGVAVDDRDRLDSDSIEVGQHRQRPQVIDVSADVGVDDHTSRHGQ